MASTSNATRRAEPTEPFILSVGRLIERKGFDRLIEAFAQDRAGEFPGYRLKIVGRGPLERVRLKAAIRTSTSCRTASISSAGSTMPSS